MRKTILLAAMLAMALMMVAAPLAIAHDRDNDNINNNERHFFNNLDDLDDLDDDLVFTGFSPLVVVDDLDVEQVGDDNQKEGECRVEDRDHDGFITEVDLECFV